MEEGMDEEIVSEVIEKVIEGAVKISDIEVMSFENYIKEKFISKKKKINDLINAENPEETPYQTKYEATKLLLEISLDVEKYLNSNIKSGSDDDDNDDEIEKWKDFLGQIHYRLALVYFTSEELQDGQKCAIKALEYMLYPAIINSDKIEERTDYEKLLSADDINCIYDGKWKCWKFFPLVLDLLNQLGILWSNRQKYEAAEYFLGFSEKLYLTKKKFLENEEEKEKEKESLHFFPDVSEERLYTSTVFYLAQVYGLQNRVNESAAKCQLTLERQLAIADDFDEEEWARNAIGLCAYYIEQKCFETAELCLHAAQHVVYSKKQETLEEKSEEMTQINADMNQAWGGFCCELLKQEYKINFGQKEKGDEKSLTSVDDKNRKLFPLLPEFNLLYVMKRPVKNVSDAQIIFNIALEYFEKSLEYYCLDGYVTENIRILDQIDRLWKVMLLYEANLSKKCSIYYKQIRLYEPVIVQLNPSYFEFPLKQMSFRLGEIYSSLIEVQTKILEAKQIVKDNYKSFLMEFNGNVAKAISYFEDFVKMFVPRGKTEANVESENEEAYLSAHFTLARLYSKPITSTPTIEIQNLGKSLLKYEWLRDYQKQKKPSIFKEELDVCVQMCDLIPIKMRHLMMAASFQR